MLRDLAHSEDTARQYTRRLAHRLGETSPGLALAAIDAHAAELAAELRKLGAVASRTTRIASWFAMLGHAVIDPLVPVEVLYRDALTELRRGLDAARLLREVAFLDRARYTVKFCDLYLVERGCLLEAMEQAMSWFAVDALALAGERAAQLALPGA